MFICQIFKITTLYIHVCSLITNSNDTIQFLVYLSNFNSFVYSLLYVPMILANLTRSVVVFKQQSSYLFGASSSCNLRNYISKTIASLNYPRMSPIYYFINFILYDVYSYLLQYYGQKIHMKTTIMQFFTTFIFWQTLRLVSRIMHTSYLDYNISTRQAISFLIYFSLVQSHKLH